MGLFKKEYCDICGNKLALLGNLRLEDGNVCKDCADQLSPFMVGRKNYTTEDIRQHLAYREENRMQLSTFVSSRVYGETQRMYVDEANGRFLVSRSERWADNPDILYFSQVLSCESNITEHRREINEPDMPPREICEYEFDISIQLNHPWFNHINFNLTSSYIPDIYSDEYYNCECQCAEIHNLLMPAYPVDYPVRQVRPVIPRPGPVMRPGPGPRPGMAPGPSQRPMPPQGRPMPPQNRPMPQQGRPVSPAGGGMHTPAQGAAGPARPVQSPARPAGPGMNAARPGQAASHPAGPGMNAARPGQVASHPAGPGMNAARPGQVASHPAGPGMNAARPGQAASHPAGTNTARPGQTATRPAGSNTNTARPGQTPTRPAGSNTNTARPGQTPPRPGTPSGGPSGGRR